MERRTFLCVLGAAGAAATAISACGGGTTAAPFQAGNVSDHAVGVWKLYASSQAIVGRDAMGFFAFSAVCTHQQNNLAFLSGSACAAPSNCTSQSSTGNTQCPVHFSRFDGTGSVTQGPAASALGHFHVTINGGVISVDPGTSVSAATRVSA